MDAYKNFIRDSCYELRRRAFAARDERNKAAQGSNDRSFLEGRLLAFNEVISLLQQNGRGFSLDLGELCLNDDLVPDRDLV